MNESPAWQLPLQWPSAPASGRRRASPTERLLKGGLVLAALALTVLDRFGLRVAGDTSISVGMMAMYGLAGGVLFAGAAELNWRAALAYLGVVGVASLSFLVNLAFAPAAYVSTTSFLLLIAVFAPVCISLRPGVASSGLWRWTVNLYVAFALFVGVAGIAQYFAQFAFHAPWLFDYTPLLPERLQATRGWATVISTGQWIKSNGFFLREPSLFSIVVAFGLICELSLERRRWVMAVLALALLVSYSGSGLLCLGVAMLFPLRRGMLARALALTILAAAVFFLFGDALHLSYTLHRVDEFSSTHSSAYCRFIYPTLATVEQIRSNPWAGLLGHGPGSIVRMGATCSDAASTALSKALFEYGVLGTLAFGALILGALNRSAAPARMRVGAGIAWLLLNGLLAAETLLLIYVISSLWPAGAAGEALSRSPGDEAPSRP